MAKRNIRAITKQAFLPIGCGLIQKDNIHQLLAGATAHRIVRTQSTAARWLSKRSLFATFLCLCIALLGCEKPVTEIDIYSFEQEQLGAEQYVESFPDGSFTRDAYKNINITFEIPPTLVTIERPATASELAAMPALSNTNTQSNDVAITDTPVIIRANSAAPSDADDSTNTNADITSVDNAEGTAANDSDKSTHDDVPMIEEQVYVGQLLHVEMLWQPKPGKTYAERTQTDAGITYCLQRGSDRARYEGAGFVYFTLADDGRTMTGEIESATLYPAGATDDSVAVLGPCRIRGPFVATLSANGVMSVKRRIRSEFEDLDGMR